MVSYTSGRCNRRPFRVVSLILQDLLGEIHRVIEPYGLTVREESLHLVLRGLERKYPITHQMCDAIRRIPLVPFLAVQVERHLARGENIFIVRTPNGRPVRAKYVNAQLAFKLWPKFLPKARQIIIDQFRFTAFDIIPILQILLILSY